MPRSRSGSASSSSSTRSTSTAGSPNAISPRCRRQTDAVVAQWEMVDEGWGRRAADFASLCEPQNCREYIAVHQRLGVSEGVRLLDVACGSGLAIELAAIQGATCSGLDASP